MKHVHSRTIYGAYKGILYLVRLFCSVCTEKKTTRIHIYRHSILLDWSNLEVKPIKARRIKLVFCVYTRKIKIDHFIGGNCINGRTLDHFGDVCAGPAGQLSRWTCFSRITNKKKLSPKIKRKKKYRWPNCRQQNCEIFSRVKLLHYGRDAFFNTIYLFPGFIILSQSRRGIRSSLQFCRSCRSSIQVIR